VQVLDDLMATCGSEDLDANNFVNLPQNVLKCVILKAKQFILPVSCVHSYQPEKLKKLRFKNTH
jgi:hypothetical protein